MPEVAAIIDHARACRQQMLALTRQLVGVPSENPPGSCYRECVELLSRHLADLGFEPQIAGDCLLCFFGEGKRTLYFSGHYDVVPAQNQGQFEPVIKGGNLFGRGSSDMKSGLAAMIYAAKTVRDSGVEMDGRIGLVFVPDEETAGPRGSRFLDEQGVLGRDGIGMLTPEPSGGVVWNANRGAITLKITVRGKAAHVGRQFEGVNAFEGMMAIAQELAGLKNEVENRVTRFSIRPEHARRSILMMGGQSGGGTNFNVVPDGCWFTIDRRINPEEDFNTEKERIMSLIDRQCNPGSQRDSWSADVGILQEGKPAGVAENALLGVALRESIERVTGVTPQFEMCPGLLEIRFYAERGIPAYAYGPGLLTVSHGPNEFVPIDNIVDCAAIYAMTAAAMLRTR
jgi:acetylornithine deacetylase/succinyl-diaminopimelate desuccinylase family protein